LRQHPGSEKTSFCAKLLNQLLNQNVKTFFFLLSLFSDPLYQDCQHGEMLTRKYPLLSTVFLYLNIIRLTFRPPFYATSLETDKVKCANKSCLNTGNRNSQITMFGDLLCREHTTKGIYKLHSSITTRL
jgi:hypothetical protein